MGNIWKIWRHRERSKKSNMHLIKVPERIKRMGKRYHLKQMIQTFHSEVTRGFNIHVRRCWTSLIREMQIITNTRCFTPTKLEKFEESTILSKWKCGAVGTLINNIQKCKSVQSFCYLKNSVESKDYACGINQHN